MTGPRRKGARRISEIPPAVLEALNIGQTETVNLVEWLAVDRTVLLQTVLPKIGLRAAVQPALAEIAKLPKVTQTKISPAVGAALLTALRGRANRAGLFEKLAAHPSDIVRSWAVYVVGFDDELKLKQKLAAVRRFAADGHFGLREEAWFAVRADIDRELDKAIELLAKWTRDKDEKIRRFASEATRPRGVWCKHIEALKLHPELGASILEPLRSDPSKYVRDSVANWINDASKTRPDWAKEVCARWLKASQTKETAYIIKKALRTIQNGTGR
ncbi:MAG: DNA alkylation repair protein [Blastocatellia bacterium]